MAGNDGRPPMVPEWTLADRMRKSLEAAGLGVQEMADELGVTRGAVGKWINGHVTPRRPVLMAWALRTGVPLEWLETGDADDKASGRAVPTDAPARPLGSWAPASATS